MATGEGNAGDGGALDTWMMNMATVTFVTGLCGSGKSWVAERLSHDTGAELLDELEEYPTDEKKEGYLLSLLKQGKDCIFTDFRLMFADQRQRIVEKITTSCQRVTMRWICLENNLAKANANVRSRPEKKDPEGHVALNERWSRHYTYPDQTDFPGAEIEIKEIWNQDGK